MVLGTAIGLYLDKQADSTRFWLLIPVALSLAWLVVFTLRLLYGLCLICVPAVGTGFRASLTATIAEGLTITAAVVRLFKGEKGTWYSHGEFYAYNNSSGIYENVDYISSLGRVYQLKSEPHRNKECESKFPSLHIVTDNDSEVE